jgi:hypothetical protein
VARTLTKNGLLDREQRDRDEQKRLAEEKKSYREAFFATCKQLNEKGDEDGLWRAIALCHAEGLWKPDWIDDAIVDHAHKRLSGKRNRSRDLLILETVNYWRTQEEPFKGKGKLRRLSLDDCFEITQKTLAQFYGLDDLSFDAIKKSYQRSVKRYPSLIGKVARS